MRQLKMSFCSSLSSTGYSKFELDENMLVIEDKDLAEIAIPVFAETKVDFRGDLKFLPILLLRSHIDKPCPCRNASDLMRVASA